MSNLLEALDTKIKGLGAPLQKVVDSLPCLSKKSLTKADADEAGEALAPLLGSGSHIMELIQANVDKPKAKPKVKPKKKAKLKVVKESDKE